MRGVRSFYSKKFDITKHKRYSELSDDNPNHAFDIEKHVKRKADPKKGDYALLAIKCDFVQITYQHITYNQKGKQTGKTTKTVLVPIQNTAVYYVRYTN